MFTHLVTVSFFVLGVIFGSFGNMLIYRLPRGMSIVGRSHCVQCKRTIRAQDLIPVLSFLLLRGRCFNCSKPISIRYPIVELFSGFLFVLTLFLEPATEKAFLLAIILWILFLISIIDFSIQGIPDALNFSFIAAALFYVLWNGNLSLVPAVIAGSFFAIQWFLSRGTWVGSGDIFLALGIGILLGSVPLLILCLMMSYILGGTVAAFLLTSGKKTLRGHLAFGPFLVLSTVLTLVFGNTLLSIFYLQ